LLYFLLATTVVFFAMNMGGSNIAPAFGALYGAKLIKHPKAVLFFTIFVTVGGILLGHNVVKTLGGEVIPKDYLSSNVVLVILLASASGFFITNFLKVPESISWTTVFAISGVGLALGHLNYTVYLKIIPFWLILPAVSFGLTYWLYKKIYPPRQANLYLYQKFFSNENRLRNLAFLSGLYIAFAAGTNNVANAVGPLVGAGLVTPFWGLLSVGPLFGLGGLIFGERIMTTVGSSIVPLGLISASLVSLVTASLLIFASLLGIPQSLVQLSALSIMAIGTVKHEKHLIKQRESRKIFFAWLITPLLSFCLGFLLTKLFII